MATGLPDLSKYKLPAKQPGAVLDLSKYKIKTNNTPTKDPGFFSKLGSNFIKGVKTVGNFLSQSEQATGQDIAGAIIPHLGITKEASAASQSADANVQKLTQRLRDAQAKGDTATVNRLSAFLQNKGVSRDSFDVSQIDPTLAKSNTQIAGDFAGTALDILAAGSYGNAAKGAKTGSLLTKSGGVVENLATKVGVPTTEKVATSIAEQGAKQTAKQTAKTLALKSSEGAAQGYGYDVSANAQSGKQGLEVLKPGVGTATGLLTPFVSALVGSLVKGVSSKLSGAGNDVIQRAIDNPSKVQTAINKYAKSPESKAQLVTQATDAISNYAKQKTDEYAQRLSSLVAEKPISKDIITTTFQDSVKNFGGRIDAQGNLIFGDSALTSADKTNLTNAWNDIKGWKDVTPQGMDTLRQNIGNNMKDFKVSGNPRANVVLGTVKNTLTKTMKEAIPGYSKMLADYGDKAEVINDFAKEFQLSGTAKDSTKLNNLLRIFKKDPQAIENLTKIMGKEEANQFLNEISGVILSDWINPRKIAEGISAASVFELASHSHPVAALITAAMSSPRIVGQTATTLGKATEAGLGTAARRTLIKVAAQNSSQSPFNLPTVP